MLHCKLRMATSDISKARATRIQAVLSFAALCELVPDPHYCLPLSLSPAGAFERLCRLSLLDAGLERRFSSTSRKAHRKVFADSGESEPGDVLIATPRSLSAS